MKNHLGILLAIVSLNSSASLLTNEFGVSSTTGIGSLTQLASSDADGWIDDASITWTHTYNASDIGTINSATIHFDLMDADFGSLEVKHNGFTIGIADPGGPSVTSSTGGPGAWHEYHSADTGHEQFTFNIDSSLFGDLLLGSFSFTGLNQNMTIWGTNKAILTIDYEQVSQVPVPAAFWLFGSGFIGLIGIKRKSLKELSLSTL